VTVVSTFFSTPIVKFPEEPESSNSVIDGGNGTGGQSYVTSQPALKLWSICAGTATAVCLLLAWTWIFLENWIKGLKQTPPNEPHQSQVETKWPTSHGNRSQRATGTEAAGVPRPRSKQGVMISTGLLEPESGGNNMPSNLGSPATTQPTASSPSRSLFPPVDGVNSTGKISIFESFRQWMKMWRQSRHRLGANAGSPA